MKLKLIALAGALMSSTAALAAPAADPAPALHSYILLDRTGSMADLWDEALISVNSYAQTVGEARPGETADALSNEITLAVFDHQAGLQFDVLRRKTEPGAWRDVTSSEASPRGMTPLFDAIGRTMALAEADNPDRAVIVIMTDGHENASQEYSREAAGAALDRAEARGWEVVFLGADFGQFGDAQGMGVAQGKTMGIRAGSMQESLDRLATKARDYGTGAEAEVTFDAEDRAIAREEEVTGPK
ncbi:MAG: vWA domain-containing protein [Pseudomonadota bacterium]